MSTPEASERGALATMAAIENSALLPFGPKALLHMLARRADHSAASPRPGWTWISIPGLAHVMGLSERTIAAYLDSARAAGWLASEAGGPHGCQWFRVTPVEGDVLAKRSSAPGRPRKPGLKPGQGSPSQAPERAATPTKTPAADGGGFPSGEGDAKENPRNPCRKPPQSVQKTPAAYVPLSVSSSPPSSPPPLAPGGAVAVGGLEPEGEGAPEQGARRGEPVSPPVAALAIPPAEQLTLDGGSTGPAPEPRRRAPRAALQRVREASGALALPETLPTPQAGATAPRSSGEVPPSPPAARRPAKPRESEPYKSRDRLAAAYAAGIREASGQRFAEPARDGAPFPTPKRGKPDSLMTIAATYLPGKSGEALDAALRALAAEYWRARSAAAVYESGFSPAKCLAWLQSGKAARPAGGGAPRPAPAPAPLLGMEGRFKVAEPAPVADRPRRAPMPADLDLPFIARPLGREKGGDAA